MIPGSLYVTEEFLEPKVAVIGLTSDHFHRLGYGLDTGLSNIGFPCEYFVTVAIQGFKIEVVGNTNHVLALDHASSKQIVHFSHEVREVRSAPPFSEYSQCDLRSTLGDSDVDRHDEGKGDERDDVIERMKQSEFVYLSKGIVPFLVDFRWRPSEMLTTLFQAASVSGVV